MASANIISDKFTGQSRGFGYVEMSSQEEATATIEAPKSTAFGKHTLLLDHKPYVKTTAVNLATNAEATSSKSYTSKRKRGKLIQFVPFLFLKFIHLLTARRMSVIDS